MTHTSRNPAGANGWASGDTSSYLSPEITFSRKTIKTPPSPTPPSLLSSAEAPCPMRPARYADQAVEPPKTASGRVLRVWQSSDGFASYYCARCGIRGWARESEPRGWLRTGEAAPPRAPQPDAAQQARIE